MIVTKLGLECDGQDGDGCEVGIDADSFTPTELVAVALASNWQFLGQHPATGKPATVCEWCWEEMQADARGEAASSEDTPHE